MTFPVTPALSSPTPGPAFALPSFAELYERLLVGPLFRPWAELLLDRVSPDPGSRVLDVACGTGIVSRLAQARVGDIPRIVAVDRSAAMLAVARATAPEIDWREGDATALPIRDDERFDAAFCHQGLQFFPDKPAAVREIRRVLAPGGRIGIGVWGPRETNPLFHELDLVAERFVGPVQDVRFGFPDVDALARLLTDARCREVTVETMATVMHLTADPVVLAYVNASAMVGMSAAGKTMSEEQRAELATTIVNASLGVVARYTDGGEIVFRASANIATARV